MSPSPRHGKLALALGWCPAPLQPLPDRHHGLGALLLAAVLGTPARGSHRPLGRTHFPEACRPPVGAPPAAPCGPPPPAVLRMRGTWRYGCGAELCHLKDPVLDSCGQAKRSLQHRPWKCLSRMGPGDACGFPTPPLYLRPTRSSDVVSSWDCTPGAGGARTLRKQCAGFQGLLEAGRS